MLSYVMLRNVSKSIRNLLLLIMPELNPYTGWFLEADIFNRLSTRYVNARESFSSMENSLHRLQF